MAKVTWLGDEDASVQVIHQFGHTFVKGEPTDVPDKHGSMGRLKANRFFSVGKAHHDVIESEEPEAVEEDGTELAAVKAELDRLGVKYRPNSGLETLRRKLADATPDEA